MCCICGLLEAENWNSGRSSRMLVHMIRLARGGLQPKAKANVVATGTG